MIYQDLQAYNYGLIPGNMSVKRNPAIYIKVLCSIGCSTVPKKQQWGIVAIARLIVSQGLFLSSNSQFVGPPDFPSIPKLVSI